MAVVWNLVLLLLLSTTIINGSEIAYDVAMSCNFDPLDPTSKAIETKKEILTEFLAEQIRYDNPKGYRGTIGIVGGSANSVGPIYFTAMTAMKLGIDEVKVFCDEETAASLRRLSSDVSVFTTLGKNGAMERTIEHLQTVDVVVLGPGLEFVASNKNSVIPKVIKFCKEQKKPLVIDLEAWFITTEFVNEFFKYPESGVIFIPNQKEFERLYQLMKKSDKTNSTKVELDEVKFGSHIYVLRKGCVDRGISMNKDVSWTSLTVSSRKRSNGQGSMLAGAVAAHYFWALKHMEMTLVRKKPSMFQAGVATFAASNWIRTCGVATYERFRGNMMTSDMLKCPL